MKKFQPSLILLVCFCQIAFSQGANFEACNAQFTNDYLHANAVRASATNIGTLFFNGSGGGYLVPYNPPSFTNSTASCNGLWLGAKDAAGNIKVAVAQYGLNSGNVDYWPGPLNGQGVTEYDACENWNRIWSARRHEISTHLVEYLTIGSVPNPLFGILTWPGKGNPYFADEMGFPLPNTPQGLAPFFDQNNDGIYDPKAGDFPKPNDINVIPDQIIWSVFNDQGGGAIHGESEGSALKAEVHFTAWAFDCTDNSMLDRTVFASYKVINRSPEAYDSIYIGLFHDTNLGCHLDDGAGCNEQLNTVFQYNLSDMDGGTSTGCPFTNIDFLSNPPVLSLTFLNRDLTHFMPLNPACVQPQTGIDFYKTLQAKTFFGNITYGEDGCNPANSPTNLAFPGDPNDPDEWSMLSANVYGFDVKTIASTFIEKLDPGESEVLDFAFGYHRLPNGTNLENVTLMYDEVAQIKELYDQHFENACTQATVCQNNCVWPGDANRDEIANYRDLLPVGVSLEKSGSIRAQSTNYWAPFPAQNWTLDLPGGLNQKHTDCDGSGLVTPEDFNLTVNHYNFTTPDFQPAPDVYNPGPELYFQAAGNTDVNNLEPEQEFFLRVRVQPVPDLYGLAFQVDYDQRYFSGFDVLGDGYEIDDDRLTYDDVVDIQSIHGLSEHAVVLRNTGETIQEGNILAFSVQAASFQYPLNSNQTTVNIKNILAIREDGTTLDIGATPLTFTFPNITVSSVNDKITEKIKVFPNPSSGEVIVSLPGQIMDGIMIFDAMGKLVFKEKLGYSEEWTGNLNHLAKGFYFLKVNIGENSFHKKFLLVEE